MQRSLVVCYRRFGTTYWPHFQTSRKQAVDCLPLVGGADTSLANNQAALCNNLYKIYWRNAVQVIDLLKTRRSSSQRQRSDISIDTGTFGDRIESNDLQNSTGANILRGQLSGIQTVCQINWALYYTCKAFKFHNSVFFSLPSNVFLGFVWLLAINRFTMTSQISYRFKALVLSCYGFTFTPPYTSTRDSQVKGYSLGWEEILHQVSKRQRL
jgi:hypothetical protein